MSFDRLLNPRTIATFGGANAQEVIRQSDRMGYKGEIWPVHPKKTEILGRKVYRSVAGSTGESRCCLSWLLIATSPSTSSEISLSEMRAARSAMPPALSRRVKRVPNSKRQLLEASGDMPLIGPNCYGLLNYLNGAMLWPDQQGGRRVDEGVAIITMSSNVGFNLTMQRRGLPIAYMVSLGNRLKFDLHDAIHIFARQDQVTALGLFLETMPDPKAFQEGSQFRPRAG